MKATAKAPANIAFIKYWGKRDEILRLPVNNSVSMNLSDIFTTTTVEFLKNIKKDEIRINNETLSVKEKERIVEHLNRVRAVADIKDYARVVTQNNFPKGTGIASSASGFAALTLAAVSAAGLGLDEKAVSILARQGSGSACRSVPDGFVEWEAGNCSEDSFSFSIFPQTWWNLRDIVVLISKKSKRVSSSEGHSLTESSPFYKTRIQGMSDKIKDLKDALKNKDFGKFGLITETEALNMHAVMMTSTPPIFYWLPKTLELMLLTRKWREEQLPVYFTIDAGSSIHLICEGKSEKRVTKNLKDNGFDNFVINKPSRGTHLVDEHLF